MPSRILAFLAVCGLFSGCGTSTEGGVRVVVTYSRVDDGRACIRVAALDAATVGSATESFEARNFDLSGKARTGTVVVGVVRKPEWSGTIEVRASLHREDCSTEPEAVVTGRATFVTNRIEELPLRLDQAPFDGGTMACARTCAGCCDQNGTCHLGDTAQRCGFGGALCVSCATGTTCSARRCLASDGGSGGGAGGGTGGGTAGGVGGGAAGGLVGGGLVGGGLVGGGLVGGGSAGGLVGGGSAGGLVGGGSVAGGLVGGGSAGGLGGGGSAGGLGGGGSVAGGTGGAAGGGMSGGSAGGGMSGGSAGGAQVGGGSTVGGGSAGGAQVGGGSTVGGGSAGGAQVGGGSTVGGGSAGGTQVGGGSAGGTQVGGGSTVGGGSAGGTQVGGGSTVGGGSAGGTQVGGGSAGGTQVGGGSTVGGGSAGGTQVGGGSTGGGAVGGGSAGGVRAGGAAGGGSAGGGPVICSGTPTIRSFVVAPSGFAPPNWNDLAERSVATRNPTLILVGSNSTIVEYVPSTGIVTNLGGGSCANLGNFLSVSVRAADEAVFIGTGAGQLIRWVSTGVCQTLYTPPAPSAATAVRAFTDQIFVSTFVSTNLTLPGRVDLRRHFPDGGVAIHTVSSEGQAWDVSGPSSADVFAGGWSDSPQVRARLWNWNAGTLSWDLGIPGNIGSSLFFALDVPSPSLGFAAGNVFYRWNGSTWSDVGQDPPFTVYGLKVISANEVFATGTTTPPGTTRVGLWNGSTWTLLGGTSLPGGYIARIRGTNRCGLYGVGGAGSVITTAP